MIDPNSVAVIGGDVVLPRLGFGTGPLGNLYAPVVEELAAETLRRAWQRGLRYFDTAPLYGLGLAEQRLGSFLGEIDRAGCTISTKVGRLLVRGEPPEDRRVPRWERDLWEATPTGIEPLEDYRADAVTRSLEASLERLNLDRVDMVQIHVPDRHVGEALDGAVPALTDLRNQGVIGAFGVGAGNLEVLARFVREADLDCILLAGSWTIIDRSAATTLLPLCQSHRVPVVMGSVLVGGLLVDTHPVADRFPGADERARRIERVRRVCLEWRIPVIAAALQFPFRHPAVASVLVGARTPAEVDQDVEAFRTRITDTFWEELEG